VDGKEKRGSVMQNGIRNGPVKLALACAFVFVIGASGFDLSKEDWKSQVSTKGKEGGEELGAKSVKPRALQQDMLDGLWWTRIESETGGVATVRGSSALDRVKVALGASATTTKTTAKGGGRTELTVEEVRASRRGLERAEESG
jgi:hypothetical protein